MEDWKVKFDPEIVLMDTMDLVIVPIQEQVGGLLLTEILQIIDNEKIIRTGHYRESIMPTSLPTRDNPTIEIASVDCDYAVHLEYGTHKQKAKAVFTRAMQSVKEHLSGLGKGKITKDKPIMEFPTVKDPSIKEKITDNRHVMSFPEKRIVK